MITQAGENEVGRVLSSFLGTHIAVGVGTTAATVNDTRLGFEIFRAPILVRSYDPITNTLIYKASLPENLVAYITEVGILSSANVTASEGVITRFDQGAEEWTGGTFTTTNVRVGSTGLNLALATASTTTGNRVALTDTRQSDIIQVAYFGAGGTLQVRLTNSSTDYFSFSFNPTAGYNVYSIPLSSLTKTGTPDLAGVEGVTVIHSGSGNVTIDAIKVTSDYPDEQLIMRQIFSPAETKVSGMPLDIEVPLVVTL